MSSGAEIAPCPDTSCRLTKANVPGNGFSNNSIGGLHAPQGRELGAAEPPPLEEDGGLDLAGDLHQAQHAGELGLADRLEHAREAEQLEVAGEAGPRGLGRLGTGVQRGPGPSTPPPRRARRGASRRSPGGPPAPREAGCPASACTSQTMRSSFFRTLNPEHAPRQLRPQGRDHALHQVLAAREVLPSRLHQPGHRAPEARLRLQRRGRLQARQDRGVA